MKVNFVRKLIFTKEMNSRKFHKGHHICCERASEAIWNNIFNSSMLVIPICGSTIFFIVYNVTPNFSGYCTIFSQKYKANTNTAS